MSERSERTISTLMRAPSYCFFPSYRSFLSGVTA